MKRKKRVIYTSLNGFTSKRNKVKDYTELDEEFVWWVNENSVRLLVNRNKAELLAGEELKKYVSEVHEQVFFQISGHSYFLDYYLPNYKLAIEIDGSYHKTRRKEDIERDTLFSEIGIRTVRIKAKDVLKGEFMKSLKESLTSKTTKKVVRKRYINGKKTIKA